MRNFILGLLIGLLVGMCGIALAYTFNVILIDGASGVEKGTTTNPVTISTI